MQLVAEYIRRDYEDKPDSVLIVLPGKRAALFLKQQLAAAYERAAWLPVIINTEELMSALSGLQAADETDLLCILYDSYRQITGTGAESFESFARWGGMFTDRRCVVHFTPRYPP